jgi:small GTP-binding protein
MNIKEIENRINIILKENGVSAKHSYLDLKSDKSRNILEITISNLNFKRKSHREIIDLIFRTSDACSLTYISCTGFEPSELTILGSKIKNINFTGIQLDSLDFINNLISLNSLTLSSFTLPSNFNLTNKLLKEVHIHEGRVRSLDFLKELKSLQILSLITNDIHDISPITGLSDLIELNISDNSVADISLLTKFKKLRKFWAFSNKITDISVFSYLPELTELGIGKNPISPIDLSIIENLGNLKRLQLSHLPIKKLPQLKKLRKLKYFYASNCLLSEIEGISSIISNLDEVDLNGNLLTELPSWVTSFNHEISYYRFRMERIMSLDDNPILNPPIEVMKQGNLAIRTWINEDKVYLDEVKVLLVGHGEVGKTSLVKRLSGLKANRHEKSTHNINISNHIQRHNKRDILLKFWDFGGQEVMHSTHQFFLSQRSLYLLVLDGRKDEDAEYWLKHIESFGGDSPVVLVLNKMDTNPSFDVDRRFLQNKYPFIAGFCKTNCFENNGVIELKSAIRKALDKVKILSAPWPLNWLKVKNILENREDDFISQNAYETVCEECGIYDSVTREILAEYLNDIGVVVHFKDLRLSDLHILQPRWVSRAAYKIINSTIVSSKQGLLACSDLPEIMKQQDADDFIYKRNSYPYILDLMSKFDLCFSLVEGESYLIPELLGIQQPEIPKVKGPTLQFVYKYDGILPRSIITRFIVRMHNDIKDNLRWRTGVVLEDPVFKCQALVVADVKEKRIDITVQGKRNREYFAVIRKTFDSLHKAFEKLGVSEWIPLPDSTTFEVEYDELIGQELMNEEFYKVGKLQRKYKVKDLLNGIEYEQRRNSDKYVWDVFLCHSSSDKELIKEIAIDLKERGVRYWLDSEQIRPGDSIIDKINDGLLKSRTIAPCFSERQIESGWCKKEYNTILNRTISGTSNQIVVPLILDDLEVRNLPVLFQDIRTERHNEKDSYNQWIDFISGLDDLPF